MSILSFLKVRCENKYKINRKETLIISTVKIYNSEFFNNTLTEIYKVKNVQN